MDVHELLPAGRWRQMCSQWRSLFGIYWSNMHLN